MEVCYICEDVVPEGEGVLPCNCTVPRHRHCMQQCIRQKREQNAGQIPETCEVCRAPYRYETTVVKHFVFFDNCRKASVIPGFVLLFFLYVAFHSAIGIWLGGHELYEALSYHKDRAHMIVELCLISFGISLIVFLVLLSANENDDFDNRKVAIRFCIFYATVIVTPVFLFALGMWIRKWWFDVDDPPRYWSVLSLLAGVLFVVSGITIAAIGARLYSCIPKLWQACYNFCYSEEIETNLATTQQVVEVGPPAYPVVVTTSSVNVIKMP